VTAAVVVATVAVVVVVAVVAVVNPKAAAFDDTLSLCVRAYDTYRLVDY
jgi:hypothetical protein